MTRVTCETERCQCSYCYKWAVGNLVRVDDSFKSTHICRECLTLKENEGIKEEMWG
jgi:hypothetical protein